MRFALALLLTAASSFAQDPAAIDKTVNDVLAKTGAPSASIAVVKDGKIVYEHAYGTANLETNTRATPQMRYSIGSISKQFTATAILMLAEEGKLSLDDRAVRWFPDLTRAKDISVRQLLSMTSGFQDFWPQDYVMPMMRQPVTAAKILEGWAKIPLDFEPGAKWQYSNTNYIIAGLIVEKASGMPLLDFLQQRIFTPLNMTSVTNTDAAPLDAGDPTRYMRYALGPPRPAPKEGAGWMFAAGELAMTAHDLALWDISLIEQSLMSPKSYLQLELDVRLTTGVGTRYGLGVSLGLTDGRRLVAHGGEVSGFTARNEVYPDQRVAVVALTNLDATDASSQIATKIASHLFNTTDSESDTALASVKKIFEGLQRGSIDRALFTPNANSYFTDAALTDIASSLAPLGKPQEVTQLAQSLRGGMKVRRYRVKFAQKALRITTLWMPDGRLEEFQIAASE